MVLRVILAVDDSVEEGAFIYYKYDRNSLWLSIKKYKTIERIINAVSPKGIYNENIIV